MEEGLEQQDKKSSKTGIKKEMRDWFISVLVAVVVTILLTQFVIVNAKIPSASMENTIMTGDHLIGLRFAYWFSDIQQGDIVIFKYPDNEKELFVKRVIGMPGDIVEIKDGLIYINGSETPLDEPYLKEPVRTDLEVANKVYEVPEGHYFMLGDNRNASMDSRYWTNTYVAENKIVGKAWLRVFPSFGLLK